MEKRLFLAIALSILVLMLYSGVATRFSPPALQDQPLQETTITPAPVQQPENTLLLPEQNLALQDTTLTTVPTESLENSDISLVITTIGTGIKECKISTYNSNLIQINMGLLAEWQNAQFSVNSITSGMAMSYMDSARNLEVTKTYRLTDSKYVVEMDVEFISHSYTNSYVQYSVNVGSMTSETIKNNPLEQRYLELSVALPNEVVRNTFLKFNPKSLTGSVQWVGIRDRYFCVILKPQLSNTTLTKSASTDITSYWLQVPQFELLPGARVKHTYLLYLGPQKLDFIQKLGSGAEGIVNYGKLDFLSQILLGAIRALYKISKNWGVAIILFSLLAFLVMSPLSIKSFQSMKRMQELQPIIEELKVKYKDNPQRMNKEVMEIYREKKINPLGGCLPMLLQMPIFIALYQTLMRFIDLKGANFLWIKDLSEPDRLFIFPNSLPVVGNELNVLPLIMIVTMLLQQKLTSPQQSQSSSTAQQQKMMSLFMSVFFGIIFYHMPSGLVLYWSINSILMLVFQKKIQGAKPAIVQ